MVKKKKKANKTQITLHGMVTLKNCQGHPEKPNTYIYNGLFTCAEVTGYNDVGIGSIWHYIGKI